MTRDNSRVLCEPFIKGFEKFNSNTGWANTSDRKWAKVCVSGINCDISEIQISEIQQVFLKTIASPL